MAKGGRGNRPEDLAGMRLEALFGNNLPIVQLIRQANDV
jgi:hypothetical protein